jgi:hypothetical protein
MNEEVGKLPVGLDPEVLKRTPTVETRVTHIGMMKHQAQPDEARSNQYIFYSDEPEYVGGEDNHPYPLDYFTAAIGL